MPITAGFLLSGDELRARREAHGYTREQLAIETGRAVATIQDWERGVRVPPVAVRPLLERLLGDAS